MKQRNEIKYPVNHMQKEKMSKGKIIKIVLLSLLLTIILAGCFFAMYTIMYKPSVGLGKTNIIPGPNSDKNSDKSGKNDTPVISPSDDPLSLRKKDFYTFLILGRDTVGLNTDIVMLASFDVGNGGISIMQIPRDTYVEIDNYPHKINAVYSIMHKRAYNNGEKDTEEAGMRQMMDLLEEDMNICIDNYALVNLAGFRNIIDIIGGVPMYVPYNMFYEDPEQNLYINLKRGQQILNGSKAEQFVRFRENYVQGDIGRIDAQKLFLTATIEQLKKNINVTTITGLISEMIKNVKTSLSVSDLIYFAKEFYLTEDANINFVTFPGTDVRSEVTTGAWYYVMHRADMLTIINKYFNVYKNDITDSMFDRKLAFTNESKAHISKIYNALPSDDLTDYVNSAENIVDDGIDIPLLH